MKTYNELRACKTETDRIDFILSAINDHQTSPMYKIGRQAGLFYRNIDEELEKIKKYILTRKGEKVASKEANHKLTNNLFFIFCTQLVAYQLGNGVSFDDPKIKEQLGGSDFDYQLQQMLIYAYCDGESYAYVDDKGINPFCFACKTEGNEPLLIPLKDENDGEIKAAIWYWRLSPDHPIMVRLFELDGSTVYKEVRDENNQKSTLQLYKTKESYTTYSTTTEAEGNIKTTVKNADKFPIVSMRYIKGQSEIVGLLTTLFAYDLMYSGMVNKVDMNTIYWIIKNADGMSPKDDQNFIDNLFENKVLHNPEGVDTEHKEIHFDPQPYIDTIAALKDKLYTDAMAVDVKRLSGNATTVEIKAAYQQLNFKCDKIEKYLSDFIRGVLKVKGLDENAAFHFKRPNDINASEYVTMIMGIVPLIGSDMALKLICETLGLIDEYDDIKKQLDEDTMSRLVSDETEKQQVIEDITAAVLAILSQKMGVNLSQDNAQGGSEGEGV